MDSPKIILPNEVDIEFRILDTSKGIYVTCTDCDKTAICKTPGDKFAFIRNHRAEHFGEKLDS